MKTALVVVLNAVISAGISLGVLYWAPGYAPSPAEFVFAINSNTRSITTMSESVGQVIKRMNEIAPPTPPAPVKK